MNRRIFVGSLAAAFVSKSAVASLKERDDSEFLQRAIDTASQKGVCVFLPKGTYQLSRPLILRGNVSMRDLTLTMKKGYTFISVEENFAAHFQNVNFYYDSE